MVLEDESCVDIGPSNIPLEGLGPSSDHIGGRVSLHIDLQHIHRLYLLYVHTLGSRKFLLLTEVKPPPPPSNV